MYLSLCERKRDKIRRYKHEKPYIITSDEPYDEEDERSFSMLTNGNRPHILPGELIQIPLEKILDYIEDLPSEYIEDIKALQLMLYALVGKMCDERTYKRIGMLSRGKVRERTINIMHGQYIENVDKQTNEYGKERR